VDTMVSFEFQPKLNNGNIIVAVLTIFKNEAEIMDEWLRHYIWQGVDFIVLLDNGSTDGGSDTAFATAKTLGREKDIIILDAPLKNSQKRLYNDIAKPWFSQKRRPNVTIVVDLDEFMFGVEKPLADIFREKFLRNPRIGQWSCPWFVFGSSGYVKQPASVRESFVWRGENPTEIGKSVVSFELLNNFSIHDHSVSGKKSNCPRGVQLNHYPIQSWEYFSRVKMTRGDVADKDYETYRNADYFKNYDRAFNGTKDNLLKSLTTKVKRKSVI
jgi:hypothetical protein